MRGRRWLQIKVSHQIRSLISKIPYWTPQLALSLKDHSPLKIQKPNPGFPPWNVCLLSDISWDTTIETFQDINATLFWPFAQSYLLCSLLFWYWVSSEKAQWYSWSSLRLVMVKLMQLYIQWNKDKMVVQLLDLELFWILLR